MYSIKRNTEKIQIFNYSILLLKFHDSEEYEKGIKLKIKDSLKRNKKTFRSIGEIVHFDTKSLSKFLSLASIFVNSFKKLIMFDLAFILHSIDTRLH